MTLKKDLKKALKKALKKLKLGSTIPLVRDLLSGFLCILAYC